MKKTFSIALLFSVALCLKADDSTTAATPVPPTTTTTTQASNAAPAATQLSPEARYAILKKHLLVISKRMVEVQQQTPDPILKALIDEYHLDDSAGLAALPPDQGTKTLEGMVLALYQAAPSDPVAAGLLTEFHIAVKPRPASATAPASADAMAARAANIKARLTAMATRLVQVQQQTPDASIKAIIDANQLGDAAGIAALSADDSLARLKQTAIALYQASKTDPLAAQLLKEFQITYTPRPATPAPATNAPAPAN